MKSLYTLLITGIIALLSWWLLSIEQNKQIARTNDNPFIDLFINNFTLTATDETGNAVLTIKANRLEHYNDADYSQMINPTISLPQDEAHWTISANTGEIDNNHNLITLRDTVTMQQTKSRDKIIITTDSMTINAATKMIHSDDEINLRSGSLQLKSNGMIFDGQQQQLKLLSNVSSVYAPI